MYLQMSNRSNGPPPRTLKRIETRKQWSAALGAPIDTQQDGSQSDYFILDNSIRRKIKDTIMSLISHITSSVHCMVDKVCINR